MLKAELRNMERMKKREGVDMTYLKNVILKLLETGISIKKKKKNRTNYSLSLSLNVHHCYVEMA